MGGQIALLTRPLSQEHDGRVGVLYDHLNIPRNPRPSRVHLEGFLMAIGWVEGVVYQQRKLPELTGAPSTEPGD